MFLPMLNSLSLSTEDGGALRNLLANLFNVEYLVELTFYQSRGSILSDAICIAHGKYHQTTFFLKI